MAGVNPSIYKETPRHARQLPTTGSSSSTIRKPKGHAGTGRPDAINGSQNETKETVTDSVIGKTMEKPEKNLCRQSLIAGEPTRNGKDLLTEGKELCKQLQMKCT